MSTHPIKIYGAPGSPYTRKMRAVLRYRRIPHQFVIRGSSSDHGIPKIKVELMPILVFPGEDGSYSEAAIDSTPLIRRLESEYEGRSVVPSDPVVAYLDALLEDYGDEWLTKAMFHYRWVYAPDIEKAASILPRWRGTEGPEDKLAPFSKMIAERQIGRLYVVGSNETTGPFIEDSYRRFLQLFDAHLTTQPFLLGSRPGSADFGVFGQLTQLALFDPTPAAVTLEVSPRSYAWVEVVEDLSGLEVADDGFTSRDAIPDGLRALLAELGRVYAPFLLGNADALKRGADEVRCKIDGTEWVQKPFPYQGKCLAALREGREALGQDDRAALDGILAGTGCEALF